MIVPDLDDPRALTVKNRADDDPVTVRPVGPARDSVRKFAAAEPLGLGDAYPVLFGQCRGIDVIHRIRNDVHHYALEYTGRNGFREFNCRVAGKLKFNGSDRGISHVKLQYTDLLPELQVRQNRCVFRPGWEGHVDAVPEILIAQRIHYLLDDLDRHIALSFFGTCPEVRGMKYVRQPDEGMIGPRGLFVIDVDRGRSDFSGGQSISECLFVDQLAARGVDDDDPVLGLGQGFSIQYMQGFI